MKYTFDGVLHIGFSFSVCADSYEEALDKCNELKRTRYYYEFPDASEELSEIELHLCYAEKRDGNKLISSEMVDEWI